MAYKIPVYLFTGFLEGGKTHMIQESMESEQFLPFVQTMCSAMIWACAQ